MKTLSQNMTFEAILNQSVGKWHRQVQSLRVAIQDEETKTNMYLSFVDVLCSPGFEFSKP